MEITVAISTISLALTVLAVGLAAQSDLRTREIRDGYWGFVWVLGIISTGMCDLLSNGPSWELFAIALSQGSFMAAVLTETRARYLIPECVSGLLALAVFFIGEGHTAGAISVFACFVFHGAYEFGIVRGGADAKCLMALAIAVPQYPEPLFSIFPEAPGMVESIIIPSVSVLFLASVMSVLGCILYCTVRSRGGSIRGYMMPAADVPDSFVWPAERLVNGDRERCGIPDDGDVERICREYQDAGIDEMFVTPMMPFIVPIAAALAMTALFGNPLFIL